MAQSCRAPRAGPQLGIVWPVLAVLWGETLLWKGQAGSFLPEVLRERCSVDRRSLYDNTLRAGKRRPCSLESPAQGHPQCIRRGGRAVAAPEAQASCPWPQRGRKLTRAQAPLGALAGGPGSAQHLAQTVLVGAVDAAWSHLADGTQAARSRGVSTRRSGSRPSARTRAGPP